MRRALLCGLAALVTTAATGGRGRGDSSTSIARSSQSPRQQQQTRDNRRLGGSNGHFLSHSSQRPLHRRALIAFAARPPLGCGLVRPLVGRRARSECGERVGQGGRGVVVVDVLGRGRHSERAGLTLSTSRLEGKKGGGNQDMDKDMRRAAKDLEKMEAKKKAKKELKAKRRERPSPKVAPFRGERRDDVVGVSKAAGDNPFKKNSIVSKFDVNDVRKVEFIGSFVDDESAWPKHNLPEIAFLGRSNVGKSSMLNTLFGEAVAKVSKTPGRTRQINIFKAKNSKERDVCSFADLPGYGYAKMGKETQRTIERFLEMYLARRANLKLLVLLVDSRRGPLPADAGILEYAEDRKDRPYRILVVATKVDKLNAMESAVNIKKLQDAYNLPPGHPVQFSAVSGVGRKELWSYIRQAAAAKS